MRVVNSHNEWDPLEEVIVGRLEYAMHPSWNVINEVTYPPEAQKLIHEMREKQGLPYSSDEMQAAQKNLSEFIHILEEEGVQVRRPDIIDFSKGYATPDWSVQNGFSSANPRDLLLVVGDEIIETPMADRGRYFEGLAYKSLLKEYFHQGARWTSAPKPELSEGLYNWEYVEKTERSDQDNFVITEDEPTFDAADAVRCGRDIFIQKSHVTNDFGISWLARHLGDEYQVHKVHSLCPQTYHIDTTILPLAPGKLLINPEFVSPEALPKIFRAWDIFVAPKPVVTKKHRMGIASDWLSMNMLSLDAERIIVEKSQETMIGALKRWGFKPIPCEFEHYYPFGGSFHCATLDIRRKGSLESYF